jgi:hypothetical protein
MEENESDFDYGEDSSDSVEAQSVWDFLTPEQKKQFKKLTEKSIEKMNYIG